MALPFVGDSAKNLGGFFSRCEAGQKQPSSKRRVSPSVSLWNTQKTKPFKNGISTYRFKRRRGRTIYRDEEALGRKIWGFFVGDWLMGFLMGAARREHWV